MHECNSAQSMCSTNRKGERERKKEERKSEREN